MSSARLTRRFFRRDPVTLAKALLGQTLVRVLDDGAELTGRIVAAARDKGLILLSCGQYGNVIRILVPLTATDVELNAGMDIIAECFAEL